jgi:hypothetical protein
VNFTREPIIETVITPREGCKLVVQNSKNPSQEEYLVDAVEVVSFGHSFFFRSQERPKSFLVPVSDYEILETKETRMVLKNAAPERAIKIGGGRSDAPPRREPSEQQPRDDSPQDRSSNHPDRKQGRRRRGRRGGRDRHDLPQEGRDRPLPATEEHPHHETHHQEAHHSHHEREEEDTFSEQPMQEAAPPKAPSFISKLFPPPSTLIKDTLSRYKPTESSEEEVRSGESPERSEKEDGTRFED